jgi:hypothetical protein
MAIPHWIKRNRALYEPACAAALPFLGPERFYTPFSAAARCSIDNGALAKTLLPSIRLLRWEEGLSVWATPSGEIATMESERPERGDPMRS